MRAALSFLKIDCDEVSIHLVDTKTISRLHAQFFDDPTTTDCITFPMDDPSEEGCQMLGEVFVCPATALDYAKKRGLDPYRETTLYIVHGILHLIGYDDIDPKERRTMRTKERQTMAHLEENGCLLRKEEACC